jgi:GTP-binding protein
VFDIESDKMLGEILNADDELVVAAGGSGGRGNARFATSTQRAPRYSEPGRAGDELRIRLELKLLADVGVVGLPNAGKSTFVSKISAARPQVADYPFTTLRPHLGVVAENRDVEPFVVADLPGLIEGAAAGSGLGHRFLKHVERCRTLLHLVDLSDSSNEVEADLVTIETELSAFATQLMDRKRLIVGTKLDAADDDRRLQVERAARDRGLQYREISSATGDGVEDLLHEVRRSLIQGAIP